MCGCFWVAFVLYVWVHECLLVLGLLGHFCVRLGACLVLYGMHVRAFGARFVLELARARAYLLGVCGRARDAYVELRGLLVKSGALGGGLEWLC